MWGKNGRNDIKYHYRRSRTSTSYLCGMPVGGCFALTATPQEHRCLQCQWHLTKLKPAPTAQPLKAATSPSPDASQAVAETASLQSRFEAEDSKIEWFLLDSIHQYDGKQVPTSMLLHVFESNFRTQVYKSTVSKIAELQNRLQEARSGSHIGSVYKDAQTATRKILLDDVNHQLTSLNGMREQPYFARIDFSHESSDTSEAIYIGRCTLEHGKFLVYDWRNPVCTMFYRYNPGAASYNAPEGLIKGDMLLKRQYIDIDKPLFSFTDTGLSSTQILEGDTADNLTNDEILLHMLQRNSSGKMRQIVQSIQAEQDQVIRVSGDVVVVHGPAGSGKTVVALHRAAYLLYHMRETRERLVQRFGYVSAQRMLVFSPNSIFSNYISRVLPDLNEDKIQQNILDDTLGATIKKWLPRIGRGGRYKIETRGDHLEYILSHHNDPLCRRRMETSAFKSSSAMLQSIEQFIKHLDSEVEAAFDDVDLNIYGQVITDADQRIFCRRSEMQDWYHLSRSSNSLLDSIKYVLQNLLERITEFNRTTRIPELIEQKRTVKNRDGSTKEITEARNPRLITVERLKDEYRRIEQRLFPFTEYALVDLYGVLLQNTAVTSDNVGAASPEIAEHTQKAETERRIAYEDIVPMLLLNGHYRGFEQFGDISHAVIDEAQDYSLLHYEYIKNCLPENCKLTIVGDLNQAINPYLNLRDYEGLEAVFPNRIKRMALNRSYRSSVEITDFAGGILAGNARINNVRRTGTKPKLLLTQDGKQASAIAVVLNLLEGKKYNTIAVLCRTSGDSKALFQKLKPVAQVKQLSDSAEVTQGTFVLPVQLAKGLEFDAVILHDGGQAYYDKEEERTLLYTACTRALHELYICYSGSASPLLPLANTDLYEPCNV